MQKKFKMLLQEKSKHFTKRTKGILKVPKKDLKVVLEEEVYDS